MSRALRHLVLAALVLGALAAPAAAATTPATKWLCRPGVSPNPCAPSQKTTRYTPAGAAIGVQDARPARNPKIDCFYVYPTVSDQKRLVATRTIDPEERSIALYQAARYSRVCRVFAPVYRQYTLQALTQRAAGPPQRSFVNPAAYADVVQAWRTYLRKYNHGRGVVIIGHSQGTLVLREAIAKEIDRKPSVRRLLVSAILLGGNVLVRKGADVGGDFQHIPACRSARQLGCVVAFSTFDQPVPPNAIFGRTAEKGMAVLCTNPAALGGGSGLLDPVYPTRPFAPGSTIAAGIALLGVTLPQAATPWIEAPDSYRAHCSSGAAYALQVVARAGAPTPKPSPDPTWGLHLTDANIALGNLTTLVGEQARAFSALSVGGRAQ
jgi:pimeloyl-ACP methyl ester carboxylesterase